MKYPWNIWSIMRWRHWPSYLWSGMNIVIILSALFSCLSCVEGFSAVWRVVNGSSLVDATQMNENIANFLRERIIMAKPSLPPAASVPPESVTGANPNVITVYAVYGNPATITCPGYDKVKITNNATRSNTTEVSDIYSLRWFKNNRATEYILFTYLDIAPHRIQMAQNEWKDRNITFSILDKPQVRLPNVTFKDEATYVCDLTPAATNTPTVSEVHLKVVACPETVDLVIANSTKPSSVPDKMAGNGNSTTWASTPSAMAFSPAVQSFMKGAQILVRCSAVSYPEATLTISIPGLHLVKPDWQNVTQSPDDRGKGYVRMTMEAWFTLDASEQLLRGSSQTVDCKASVANDTCVSTNSLGINLILPTTKALEPMALNNTDAGAAVVSNTLTNAQIAGIIIGSVVAVALIAGLIYLAMRHSNKELAKKAHLQHGYTVSGISNGKKKHCKKDISHPKAITAYPQAPCPKTGSVSFVDASALL